MRLPAPFRPVPGLKPGNLVPPHWPSGRKANLGCYSICILHNPPIARCAENVKSKIYKWLWLWGIGGGFYSAVLLVFSRTSIAQRIFNKFSKALLVKIGCEIIFDFSTNALFEVDS